MEQIYVILSLIVGVILGYILNLIISKIRGNKIIEHAKKDAEIIKEKRILEAKEKILIMQNEADKAINEKKNNIILQENKLKQKENLLNQKIEEVQKKQKEYTTQKEALDNQIALYNKKNADLEKIYKEQNQKLELISGYSAEEAKKELLEALKNEAKSEAMLYVKDIIEDAKMNAAKESKKIIIESIQRTAVEQAIENTVTAFPIENDEVKGRIIGREGRNIKAIESLTGVDIIVDDTPDAIILSSFDPIRRQIAYLALHRLIVDGRIHPAKIEEIVNKTKKEIEQEIIEVGKKTIIDLGILNINNELIRLIGKMKYRSSYGQNLLQHSREVANLSAIMAAELGLNAKMARRAGLLHDIGKVAENEPELPHALLGMQIAEKYKEKPEICNAIGAHHEDIKPDNLISPIVQICDAISGARPGARREVLDAYIKRLKSLEDIANSYEGVMKTFAIQAGRELRVIVASDKISDNDIQKMSVDLSQRIQNEMTYPGQIKITVIRETRAISYAK